MQVRTNERLVRRESRIGGVLLGGTFLLLMLGLLLSLDQERWAGQLGAWLPFAVTYGIVIGGMGLYYLGNARLRRFGPRFRQDGRLRQVLKGLDDRHVLYAFLGRQLPDYVLVGPSGVSVLTTRFQEGEITCRDDRWIARTGAGRRLFEAFYGHPIGRPSADADLGARRVRDLLARALPDGADRPPVGGLIVFTAERVRLRVERCSLPATTGKELRKVIGRQKGRLTQAQLGQVRAVFDNLLAD